MTRNQYLLLSTVFEWFQNTDRQKKEEGADAKPRKLAAHAERWGRR
jgi:hypothetical protein